MTSCDLALAVVIEVVESSPRTNARIKGTDKIYVQADVATCDKKTCKHVPKPCWQGFEYQSTDSTVVVVVEAVAVAVAVAAAGAAAAAPPPPVAVAVAAAVAVVVVAVVVVVVVIVVVLVVVALDVRENIVKVTMQSHFETGDHRQYRQTPPNVLEGQIPSYCSGLQIIMYETTLSYMSPQAQNCNSFMQVLFRKYSDLGDLENP